MGLILNNSSHLLYVIDGLAESYLKVVDITTNKTTTLKPLQSRSKYGFIFGDSFVISYHHGVQILDISDDYEESLAIGSTNATRNRDTWFSLSTFNQPHGIVILDSLLVLVADTENYVIRSLDFNKNTVKSINYTERALADDVKVSESKPWALIVVNNNIYIGASDVNGLRIYTATFEGKFCVYISRNYNYEVKIYNSLIYMLVEVGVVHSKLAS